MNGLRILVLAAVAALAPGCGSNDDPGPADPDPTGGALVVYSRSGGVGGIDERLRISSDGEATLSYGPPVESDHSFQLSDAQLTDIQSQLAAADFDSIPANPEPTGCADCFEYTIEYGGRTIFYDDASPPPASVAAAVAALGELAQTNQPASAGFIKGG